MIKSKYFWVAAILLAIVPLLLIDITEHYLSFKKEVREELIMVAQDVYNFDKEHKAQILDRAFERNQVLNFLIYTKSFLCLISLALCFYFFRAYRTKKKSGILKPTLFSVIVICLFVSAKFLSVSLVNNNDKIKFFSLPNNAITLDQLIHEHFNNKVVYVDFWGTTCGPCLMEFRNFTKPLKDKYRSNEELNYLYISQGDEYLWKRQIEKYEVEGFHVFLNDDQYNRVFRNSIQNDTATIVMPRYLIVDKKGEVVVTDAKRPSDKDSLFAQLDKYLKK